MKAKDNSIHPGGGRTIWVKIQEASGLDEGAIDVSFEVLRRFGNMSSVTSFFVLKAILEGDSAGRIFAAAFGPGLTLESGLLTKVGAT